MSEQIALPGFDTTPAPKPTDRLFFAVLPDVEAIADITRLAQALRTEHALRGQLLPTGRLHVSLLGVGDFPGVPPGLLALIDRVAPTLTLPAFAARFDRALSFSGKPGNRALVLRSDEGTGGFVALQRMLITAFQQAGLKIPMPSNFTPHITLAYDEQNIAERAIEPIAWTVREFVLVHSEIGRGLPYMALRRWPLQNQ